MLPRVLTMACAFTILLVVVAANNALVNSPDDILHGVYVRMLYVHIPFAYATTLIYSLITICSVWCLINPKAQRPDLWALSLAPIGTWLTVLTLVSGSLWGKQAWGTWWVWDARLTSVLVLFFTYLAYLGLRWGIDDSQKTRIPAAIFIVIGAVNIPIVKFSASWWNTVHQPTSLFNPGGIAIHPTILSPLIYMALALSLLVALWSIVRFIALTESRQLTSLALDVIIQSRKAKEPVFTTSTTEKP